MHKAGLLIAFLLSLSAMPFAAVSQEPDEQATTSQSNQTTETPRRIEQINVTAERSLLVIRNQIEREEEVLYRLFNDLNSADKYDIFCKTERRTGSYIPIRYCEPRFFTTFRQNENRGALSEMRQAFSPDGLDLALLQNGLNRLIPDRDLRAQIEDQYEELQQEMFRIATENPEYLASLQKIGELKAEYEAAREARFGKRKD